MENGLPAVVSIWSTEGTVIDYVKARPGCDALEIVFSPISVGRTSTKALSLRYLG